MKARGISLIAIKTIYAIGVFFLFLMIFSAICNQGNTDMTTTMQTSTYPVITFDYGGVEANEMHGYASQMDTSFINDYITPLRTGRKLSFRIDAAGTSVNKIRFEVRSVDGQRLIENTEVYNYLTSGNEITADITLKDLIEEETVYSLCIILETGSGRNIRYYTKIIENDLLPVNDMLSFAYYFTKTSYDQIEAGDLSTYMESNKTGDNSSYHHVDIHSSLNQLTFGKLGAEMVTKPIASLKEIDKSTAMVYVDYFITIPQDDKDIYYRVCDKYRLKSGSDRMYLLEYYRDTEQIFSLETATMANNKIVLGIYDDEVNMIESPDGNQLAFEVNNRLYSYNITDNKIASIFGFYEDGKETDLRDAYNSSGIKIFSIDETGNVYFMVYGYMNRGIHEGEMGVSFYFYNSVINNVEEKAFIPYDKSFSLLKMEIEKLSYVNQSDIGYLFVNDSLYRIDLNQSVSEVVVQKVPFNGMVVSDDSEMAAWVSGGDINNASQVVFLNMVTGVQTYIQAGDDNRIKALGFFDDDLIYGIARKDDIVTTDGGDTIFPMNVVYIRDERGNILKEYQESGSYITETTIDSAMLYMERVKKGENGYIEISPDQILNNKAAISPKNTVETVITENYEKIVQIAVKKDINTDTLQILTPRLVLYEGNRNVKIQESSEYECYYAYVLGELSLVTDDSEKAVSLCFEKSGFVLDKEGRVIYARTSYPAKNQIMAIHEGEISEGSGKEDSERVCLNSIFAFEGISCQVEESLSNGKSAYEILSENLEGYHIVNLTDCDVNTYQFYLMQDIPVYVKMKDGTTYLIVGYNEYNYVFMDPVHGNIYKVGKEDTANMLSVNKENVLTYIKK